MKEPHVSDRAIEEVMQFYRITEEEVRKLYMDEAYAMQRLIRLGLPINNS
jgi:hypothetical protein|tara:strand:+ start:1331 stop:1480 length:150 start_codon:yes stop_codon:yes gene_type:complete